MTNAKQVITRLKSLANSEIADQSQRFFKTGKGEYGEGDIFLGIRVPTIRAEVKRMKDISIDETIKILTSKYHEARLFALIMLVEKFTKANEPERTEIYRHYLDNLPQINNWDLVDSSAPYIIGVYLTDKDKSPIYQMADSDNLWQRRIAIMSTFTFIRQNDFKDALAIATTLVNDNEDLIQKAVGWMLREIGKRSLKTEERFLQKHYKSMPRTMLRYAIEKMPERKRKAYLNGSVR